ncbi:hypothetical protein [Crenothrix polyspora]|uniref:Uncharacterized protein n=1 Tax=Crenothrix polyspora TaxID=360316 RepID=A0A1R4H1Q0_9GAMM|nr:hypothetical protein [Crenothrix polyspora]SJM90171.1 hypothetical protein CRENPOLYSF1_1360017 [Crenothrix polyspora]
MKILKLPNSSTADVLSFLDKNNFPISSILSNPISAIEGMASHVNGKFVGVCARECVGCSADAIPPKNAKDGIKLLTPSLLKAIFNLAQKLSVEKTEIFSTTRLNLFSGSNELDHPYCIDLRRLTSSYFQKQYGHPYGSISSDLIFHSSPTIRFKKNLQKILDEPLLFDNICVAVDEQIPFRNKDEYDKYLHTLVWVWQTLNAALKMQLKHSREEKHGTPRVILNLLLPSPENSYRDPYQHIYPGGPRRATTYKELTDRYVKPFVGKLIRIDDPIPSHHVFTTSIGTLEYIEDSKVFISEAVYEPVGRANTLLGTPFLFSKETVFLPCIRTKIYPIDESSFVIRGCLAPNRYSDGEISWEQVNKPSWIDQLEDFILDISNYREDSKASSSYS